MRSNPIQFAVVREDPEIERALVDAARARRALLVASGGCTAFCLRSWFPRIELTLVDPNSAQLDLVRRKIAALEDASIDPRTETGRTVYGIGQDLPASPNSPLKKSAEHRARARSVRARRTEEACQWKDMVTMSDAAHALHSRANAGPVFHRAVNQCGNFESLFRLWRGFVHEFVAPKEEIEAHFAGGAADRLRVQRWLENPYWRTSFDLFFSDAMLETMFTSAATRHAERGSYPRYFKERFELGLTRADSGTNYFLHHLLLGYYRDEPSAWPRYVVNRPRLAGIELRRARLEEIDDFSGFDVIALSNVMDWMDDPSTARLAEAIVGSAERGAHIVWRQLNNAADHERRFASAFSFDHDLAAALHAADRSLFYSSLHVGVRQ